MDGSRYRSRSIQMSSSCQNLLHTIRHPLYNNPGGRLEARGLIIEYCAEHVNCSNITFGFLRAESVHSLPGIVEIDEAVPRR
jgi:hypothetical protein